MFPTRPAPARSDNGLYVSYALQWEQLPQATSCRTWIYYPSEGLPTGYWPGPPDLAVEVMSPNDSKPEVERKVQEYLRKGVRLVWVVFPRKPAVAVYRPGAPVEMLGESDALDGGEVVPGFAFPSPACLPSSRESRLDTLRPSARRRCASWRGVTRQMRRFALDKPSAALMIGVRRVG